VQQQQQEPILFGTLNNQKFLKAVHRDGQCTKKSSQFISIALRQSGLIALIRAGRKTTAVLEPANPAFEALRLVLSDLCGRDGLSPTVSPRSAEFRLDIKCPLGHTSPYEFRILWLLTHYGAISQDELLRVLPDLIPETLVNRVGNLIAAGVLRCERSTLRFADAVPNSYLALVSEIGAYLLDRSGGLLVRPEYPARVAGYQNASDGAPRLFGTDARLRNLMALAKHGPLYAGDLRRASGIHSSPIEDELSAPFGRGDLVDYKARPEGPDLSN
jgi:hypothetical protein